MSPINNFFGAAGIGSPIELVEGQYFTDYPIFSVMTDAFADTVAGENSFVVAGGVVFEFSHILEQLK